jgi:hypothetical protein
VGAVGAQDRPGAAVRRVESNETSSNGVGAEAERNDSDRNVAGETVAAVPAESAGGSAARAAELFLGSDINSPCVDTECRCRMR